MKKLFLPLVSLAAAILSIHAGASPKFVKESKDLGISEVKNCNSCHESKQASKFSSEDLNEVGKWLIERKKEKGAKEIDMAWLKEYFAKAK
jgi:cytochrome c553